MWKVLTDAEVQSIDLYFAQNVHVITEAEAEYVRAQCDLRDLVNKFGFASVQEWLSAIHLGLPLRPYHLPEPGMIGDPRR